MSLNCKLTIKKATGNEVVAEINGYYMRSVNLHLAESMTGDTLSYDTAQFVVSRVTGGGWHGFYTSEEEEFITTDGKAFLVLHDIMLETPEYPFGYRAIFVDNGSTYVFYVKSITRQSKYTYQIDCISAVGLLDTMQYDGGLWLYTSPTTVQALMNSILSGSGVSFSYDPAYASQRVSGWIPISTKREAIQNILFALGLNLLKRANGSIYVTGMDASTSTAIADERVYQGGKVVGRQAVSRVIVIEHDFVESNETEEIFKGDVIEPNTRIVFDKPYHNVVAVDGNSNPVSITAYTNYCIVHNTVNDVSITGQVYIDNRTEIENNLNNDTDKVAKVEEAYLVNSMNAESVAQRVTNYYASANTVDASIVYRGAEFPGENITLKNTFGEQIIGLISQMDIVVSAVNKANLKVVTDFNPGGAGNLWEHAVVLSTSQTWTVPAANTSGKIKIICIQGGNAGQNGMPGEDGQVQTLAEFNQLAPQYAFETDPDWVPGAPHYGGFSFPAGIGRGGNGGAPGAKGLGGKIFEQTIDVSQGDSLTVTIGAGGVPTAVSSGGELGGEGGETTVVHNGVTYSSANGTRSPSGFVSYMLPDSPAYAKPGEHDGIKGGRSGFDFSDLTPAGWSANNANGYETVVDYDGNVWRNGADTSQRFTVLYAGNPNYVGIATELCPSRGGGAAVGHNGNDGAQNVWEYTWQSIGYNKVTPGNSGDGATPIQAAAGVAYGDGGCGGHGGGGGGGKGDLAQYRAYNEYARVAVNQQVRYATYWEDDRAIPLSMMMLADSAPGHGGSAGLAGAGAQGCVIIYY